MAINLKKRILGTHEEGNTQRRRKSRSPEDPWMVKWKGDYYVVDSSDMKQIPTGGYWVDIETSPGVKKRVTVSEETAFMVEPGSMED